MKRNKNYKESHPGCLVDKLIEDEVEIEYLRTKPTCFIVVGRPGVGKSTLARRLAESWNCRLIDDTELLMTHIKNESKEGTELLNILFEGGVAPEELVLKLIIARLNSPDIDHYGYVLCCMPFLSEECMKIQEQIDLIKNLRLPPDFIINIKVLCAYFAHFKMKQNFQNKVDILARLE
ncbi:unnamed protein product [Tetraodon nigroviridis]|uniref:(spotted green pufferfish) hypothetical protein n=1 Tax=Tetraodon nigroviridis TaxID=99883 RepID=Q4S712_TETNG|nr:unnamed protein product [Tetraodon nigroviridis]